MFELSIEMSVESGSMVPFYSINAVMGNAGPKQSSDSE